MSGIKKKIDFWLGIPLVGLCGLFNRKKILIHSEELRSVAVLCVAAIGDLLIFTAPIEDFAKLHPRVQIHLFCGPDNFQMAKILQAEKSLFASIERISPGQTFSAIASLRRQKFDLLIDSGQWSRWTALLSWFARANFTTGFSTKGQHRDEVYSRALQHRNDVHELENFRGLFKPWVTRFDSRMQLPSAPERQAENVVCHLFASGEKRELKHWPNARWAEVIEYLNKNNLRVYLTGGPHDAELAKKFLREYPGLKIENRIGLDSLLDTKKLLESARLIISVNTGIMHLAASLDRPLIAIHGPTNYKRWGPLGPNSKVIAARIPCSPCLNLGFDYGCPVNLCMQSIQSEAVLSAVKEVLSR